MKYELTNISIVLFCYHSYWIALLLSMAPLVHHTDAADLKKYTITYHVDRAEHVFKIFLFTKQYL